MISEHNLCELTGVVATIEKVARTPAGVPRQRIWLEHRSRQEEDGHPRDVQLRIAVVLVDSKTGMLNTVREGQRVKVTGFLSRAGYKGEARDRLQMIAETLVLLD